jgi:hypothetical protein
MIRPDAIVVNVSIGGNNVTDMLTVQMAPTKYAIVRQISFAATVVSALMLGQNVLDIVSASTTVIRLTVPADQTSSSVLTTPAYQSVKSVMVSVTALTTVTNSTASATLSLSSNAAPVSVLTRVNFAMVP